jgi:hypothetical protein
MARLSWETGELAGTEIRRLTGSGCWADTAKEPSVPVAEMAYPSPSACGAVSSVTWNVVLASARWIRTTIWSWSSSGAAPTTAIRCGTPPVIRQSEALANDPPGATDPLMAFLNVETSPLVAAARLAAPPR